MVRLICLTGFLIFLLTTGVYGQSRAELEQRKQNTKKEIDLTNELLEKTRKEKINSLDQVNLLNKGIQATGQIISTIEGEIRLLDFAIQETSDEIKELERKVEKEKAEYERLVYSAYVSQSTEDRFMYILASESFGQAYQRIKYLKYLSEYRKNRITEIKQTITLLEERKALLEKQKADKNILVTEKGRESSSLLRKKAEKDRIIRNLTSKEAALREELKNKEKAKAQLEAEIRKVIEEEARISRSSNLYDALTPEQKLVSSEFKANKGRLPWPVERGVITVGFGKYNHPVLTGVIENNNGIDITSSGGVDARSLFDGEVSKVIFIKGANYAVLIRHGEYFTLYQNLVNVRVKAGDKVKTKQVLGEVYSGDGTENAVLHLEIWREKVILNPAEWISK